MKTAKESVEYLAGLYQLLDLSVLIRKKMENFTMKKTTYTTKKQTVEEIRKSVLVEPDFSFYEGMDVDGLVRTAKVYRKSILALSRELLDIYLLEGNNEEKKEKD